MKLKRRLLSKIQKELPTIKIRSARLITHGWDHDVLIINKDTVFRFPRPEVSHTNFQKETEFLRKFSKISNLPVPDYYLISQSQGFGEYKIMRGTKFTPNVWHKMSKAKKLAGAKKLGRFLSILHAFSVNKARKIGVRPGYMLKAFKENAKQTQSKIFPMLKKTEKDFILNFWPTYEKARRNEPVKVIHSDLTQHHILVNQDCNISGVIDFGDIALGDPASDFAGLMYIDHDLAKMAYRYYRFKSKGFLARALFHKIQSHIGLMPHALKRKKFRLIVRCRKTLNYYRKHYESLFARIITR